jgi:hypothetical protein
MLRFQIRDLLWLTVVVAVACCWWIERAAERRRFKIWQETTYNTFLEKMYNDYLNDFEKLKKEHAALKAASAANPGPAP